MLKIKTYNYAKALVSALAIISLPAIAADAVNSSINIEKKMDRDAAKSQKKINKYEDATTTMYSEYKAILEQIDQNRIYNKTLENSVNSLKAEMDSMRTQIDGIEDTEKGIAPLMIEMIESLEQFIALDVPFELDDRQGGVKQLRQLLGRGDVPTSEKFRRILEAYIYEMDYGMEIEAAQGEIDGLNVEFLRLGRIAYVYRTRDGKQAKVWDVKNKNWIDLPESYFLAIRDGIRMANNEAQKDLITLPIKAAEGAQ